MGLSILFLYHKKIMNTIDKVWVYGTLKRNYWNYGSMKRAGWEYKGKDYVQFDKIDSCGFPMIKLSEESNKWLEVEVFNVSIHWIEWPLDSLEWYTPGSDYNLYNRVKTKTRSGDEIWIYEIDRDIVDKSEDYYTHNEGEDLFFNWTQEDFTY